MYRPHDEMSRIRNKRVLNSTESFSCESSFNPYVANPLATQTPTLSPLNDIIVFVVAKRRLPRVATTSCSTVAEEKKVVARHAALPPARSGCDADGIGSAHSGVGRAGDGEGGTLEEEEGGNWEEGSGGTHLFGGILLCLPLMRVSS
jgi:hypothetical protein